MARRGLETAVVDHLFSDWRPTAFVARRCPGFRTNLRELNRAWNRLIAEFNDRTGVDLVYAH